MSTVELLNRGMNILNRELGSVDAERFISVIMREQFDYTKWQREFFDGMSQEEIKDEASKYEKEHPFEGNATVVI